MTDEAVKKRAYREQAEREQLEREAREKEATAAALAERGPRPGCDSCRAFLAEPKGPQGQCRRRAPVMVPIPVPDAANPGQVAGFKTLGLYPATHPLSWCAEWQAMPTSRPERYPPLPHPEAPTST